MERQISVRLPEELARRLDTAAEASGAPRSRLVRDALRLYLEGTAAGGEERPFDRVRELAGVAYGGPADLAARHREYLRQRLAGG